MQQGREDRLLQGESKDKPRSSIRKKFSDEAFTDENRSDYDHWINILGNFVCYSSKGLGWKRGKSKYFLQSENNLDFGAVSSRIHRKKF